MLSTIHMPCAWLEAKPKFPTFPWLDRSLQAWSSQSYFKQGQRHSVYLWNATDVTQQTTVVLTQHWDRSAIRPFWWHYSTYDTGNKKLTGNLNGTLVANVCLFVLILQFLVISRLSFHFFQLTRIIYTLYCLHVITQEKRPRHPIAEVKPNPAGLELGWVTDKKYPLLYAIFLVCLLPFYFSFLFFSFSVVFKN